MHIHTSTPIDSRQHRLFIAVPLFTLCLCVSFGLSAGGALPSAAAPADIVAPASLQLQNGVAVAGTMTLVESGSAVHLVRGSGVFAARRQFTVQTGMFTVQSWHGAVEISAADGHVLIAALTAPAVVRSTDDLWVIPAGMQMRVTQGPAFSHDLAGWLLHHRPLPLPAHYLATSMPIVEQLQQVLTDPAYKKDTFMLPPLLGQALRLEQSRIIAVERDAAHRIHLLAAAFSAGNTAVAQELLMDEQNLQALRSETGRSALPGLLSDALALHMDSLLLPLLAQNADMHLIASYHPAVRAHAWVIARQVDNAQNLLTALVHLPASDQAMEPLPAVAVEQWGAEWQALLAQSNLAGMLADAVLPRLEADILALDRAGFPERSRMYAQTLVAAYAPHMGAASDVAHSSLQRLQEFVAGNAPVTEPVTVEDAQQEAPVQEALPLEPQAAMELELQVRTLMQQKNAMFTAHTSFKAETANRVHVSNLVVATPTGDTLLRFVFEPLTGMVVDIEKDGRTLPYSLTLDRYFAWVRGE